MMSARRLTQEQAKARLSRIGWTLLSVYSTFRTPVKAQHTCGRVVKRNFGWFGPKCTCNYTPMSEVVAKRKATCLKRYGVDNPAKTREVQRKMQQTLKKRYGVSHALQSPLIRKQLRRTLQSKYGEHVNNVMDVPKIRSKAHSYFKDEGRVNAWLQTRQQTMRENYGVDHYFQSDDFRVKAESTCLKRFGVRNPMQVREIHERAMQSGLRLRDHTTSTGRTLSVQGYETRVVESLDRQGCKVRVSQTSIPYKFRDKRRVYFPDLDVVTPKKNSVLVEVKSKYTLNSDLEKNLAKFRAANRFARKRKLGFALVVYTDQGSLTVPFPTKRKLASFRMLTF